MTPQGLLHFYWRVGYGKQSQYEAPWNIINLRRQGPICTGEGVPGEACCSGFGLLDSLIEKFHPAGFHLISQYEEPQYVQ